MNQSFDLVVAGKAIEALEALAIGPLRQGSRVLVVLERSNPEMVRRVRRRLLKTAGASGRRLTVIGNTDVVCVAGTDGVEACVLRRSRTGRIVAVNTTAFVQADASAR